MAEPRKVLLNPLSLRPLWVELFFGQTHLGQATCFSWTEGHASFLITNWHVVSGRHPETRQALRDDGGIPDRLEVSLHREERLGAWDTYSVPLCDNDGRPVWLEHPIHGPRVDVVAIPFAAPAGLRHYSLNSLVS